LGIKVLCNQPSFGPNLNRNIRMRSCFAFILLGATKLACFAQDFTPDDQSTVTARRETTFVSHVRLNESNGGSHLRQQFLTRLNSLLTQSPAGQHVLADEALVFLEALATLTPLERSAFMHEFAAEAMPESVEENRDQTRTDESTQAEESQLEAAITRSEQKAAELPPTQVASGVQRQAIREDETRQLQAAIERSVQMGHHLTENSRERRYPQPGTRQHEGKIIE
jgi:CHASE3 domain sensor protein